MKMKNIFLSAIAIVFSVSISQAQDKILLDQYFQNLPAFNPALTGSNDFLDVRMGYRQQWMGFDGAPRTMYLSGYGALNNKEAPSFQRHSIRTSGLNDNSSKPVSGIPALKQGVGGNLEIDEQGPFSQTEVNLNYAVHIPISYRTYLSFGLAPGIYNAKVDFNKVDVKDAETDPTYQDLLGNGESSTFFQLSGGISLYSDRFYAAYSMMELTHSLISGNETLNNDGGSVRHQVMGGYRFYLNQDFEFVPNAFVRMEKAMPLLWDAGARVQYKGQFWMGASYRNDNSLIGMVGLLYNDMIRIGYSYGHKTSGTDTFSSGSHELVLGIQFFNHSKYISMW